MEHERGYVEHLSRERGLSIHTLDEGAGVARTLELMGAGAGLIVQAAMESAGWQGRADVLVKVATPSALGDYSYEVIDTKLARTTRVETVLQLCMYSSMLEQMQGRAPERFYVVTPGEPFNTESYRLYEYRAYTDYVARQFAAFGAGERGTYPEPVSHCEACNWWRDCDTRRRADDHLSLVAGMRKLHVTALRASGISSMGALAETAPEALPKPKRGSVASLKRVREQARVQVEGRTSGADKYELLPFIAGEGLARLPEPSHGDVFLDLEGDPFVGSGGLEYLFGVIQERDGARDYTGHWALSTSKEKQAFEIVIDGLIDASRRDPAMHIYHFGIYEPVAFKRLMGRHATREREVDELLRAGRFVDLHAVVKQAMRASVEDYGLKQLESFYAFEREMPLDEVRPARGRMERALELGLVDDLDAATRNIVEVYNMDDCASTLALRDWLEAIRAEAIANGAELLRPAVNEKPVEADPRDPELVRLYEELCAPGPGDLTEQDQHARWLLAQFLEFHWREAKPEYWEMFRLRDLGAEELLDERRALSGLTFVERLPQAGPKKVLPTDAYTFPLQECELKVGDKLLGLDGATFGTIASIDRRAARVEVKKTKESCEKHVSEVFTFRNPKIRPLDSAIRSCAEWVRDHGIASPHPEYAAAQALLRKIEPLGPGVSVRNDGETVLEAGTRVVSQLATGVLPMQGPPGAGKTYTSAKMICALLREGKRVGISGPSHAVIANLLEAVSEATTQEQFELRAWRASPSPAPLAGVTEVLKSEEAEAALLDGTAQLIAGTAWLFAREDLRDQLDVLFIDEAGQVALANAVASAQSARVVVLLGDPMQLEQPLQGSHPEGAAVSALEHMIGEGVVAHDRGLFLPETYRLPPAVCGFTSELFYEGQLQSHPRTETRRIEGPTRFVGAGLRFESVQHEGANNYAPEEVEAVAAIVAELTAGGSFYIDDTGRRAIALSDILIVAPYNAQVNAIAERIPGCDVGTVDRFQGREAPVVICSMATSSPEDAPRGMEFLYSANRLNVATSRAQALCIMVASPKLFEVECKTPRHVKLANAFCRYLERAKGEGRRGRSWK